MMRLANENDIVLVDDDEVDAYLFRCWVEGSQLTNPITILDSGDAFLDRMEEVHQGRASMPAIVFLDINMPGMSGLEVLQLLRDKPTFQELPVVTLYSHSDSDRDGAYARNYNAMYLEKFSDRDAAVDFLNSLVPSHE